VIGLLIGCGLRRSEVVNLQLDRLQLRESHWVLVDLVGKGGRLRTIPVPSWCKGLVDAWVRDSGVTEGRLIRRICNLVRRPASLNFSAKPLKAASLSAACCSRIAGISRRP
jgi:integrase